MASCRRQPLGARFFKSGTDKGGGAFHLHWLVEPPDQTGSVTAEKPADGPPELADIATRDAVYSAVLDVLTLSAQHIDDLARRGLPLPEISSRGYKSFPARAQTKVAAQMQERFGTATLLGVPGFIVNQRSQLSMALVNGLIIPVRDPEQRIVALTVRPDQILDKGAKYLAVSSARHGGPGPGTPAHVPLGITSPSATWRLTEGALKADVAAALSGFPTIGIAGASNWRPCIGPLKALGCKKVRVALDADAWEKEAVGRALEACVRGLKSEGFTVELERWDPALGKGIDDVLLAGGAVEVLTGADVTKAVAEAAPRRVSPAQANLPVEVRPLTDLGNAERFAAQHRQNVRYCFLWKSFLCYDGCRWAEDHTGQVDRLAKQTIRRIHAEAALVEDKAERTAVVEWAFASESLSRRNAITALVRSEEFIPVLPEMFDRDPWLLNCSNGTIDLRTGELRQHNREDLLTKLCPTPYDPKATCPHWLKALDTVFESNDDLIEYWQHLCGCVLTGTVTEQVLPILHGTGENGKSTILNAIMSMMGGDYAMKAPHDFLMLKRQEGHPTELADLFGKRLVVAIETGENARINEVLIKELTGTDPIRARRMRENPWEFLPTHKIMLCTNHRPVVKGTDHAIWRRIHLLPFNVKIPADQKDKGMSAKLTKEFPGILAWCVRGCLAWSRSNGLEPPSEVVEATRSYRSDQDAIGRFLEEHCSLVRSSDQVKVKASILFAAYRKWAEQTGEIPVSLTRFGEKITELGFRKKSANGIWYLGIGLRQEEAAF